MIVGKLSIPGMSTTEAHGEGAKSLAYPIRSVDRQDWVPAGPVAEFVINVEVLEVIRADGIGWSDLGTPESVDRTLVALGRDVPGAPTGGGSAPEPALTGTRPWAAPFRNHGMLRQLHPVMSKVHDWP